MSNTKHIQAQINAFLKDDTQKRLEITVPHNFKIKRNPIKQCYRRSVLFLQQWIIPSHFKNWLLRTTGMTVGDDACIPHYIRFDPLFPELITVGEGTIIGGATTVLTHERKGTTLILGRVHIKDRVLIAGMTSIYPGVTVEEKSITGVYSHIRKDVPEGSFVAGEDRLIKQWSPEELERHFGKTSYDPAYRKRFRDTVRAFQKDKTQMRVTIRYAGKRKNPGNEWYRARSLLRIYYNAVFVELARIAPGSWLRKLLLRCMGATIGKNVYIGKNVVFDHIYGSTAVIGESAYIGNGCYIDGHSYTITESEFGRVHIGKNARLENKVHVFAGVTIGDDATVRGPTSVMKDIPAGEAWAGIPAKKAV